MDAPDLDELEWMAQQEYPPEDPSDFMPHEEEPVVEEQNERQLEEDLLGAGLSNTCRKRSLLADPELEFISDNCNVYKRGRVRDAEQPDEVESVKNDWFLPEEAEWSPGPSTSGQTAHNTCSNVDPKLPAKRLADIKGNFMPITGLSRDRVYAEVKLCGNLQTYGDLQSSYRRSKDGLLFQPFESLLEQVEQKLQKEACRVIEGQESLEELMTVSATHEPLWVEKYAPKSFTELLSDEQTNREVLRWLKQWDKCVFGQKKTSTSLHVMEALRRHAPTKHTKMYGSPATSNGSARYDHDSKGEERSPNLSSNHTTAVVSSKKLPEMLDPNLDRPDEKILLLCGPPGLGKTTLAHVAARHCGYRVVEINASDDRVASTLQAKILDAVQMKSVMGDSRPNCLVIDEIDGALGGAEGKSAIDALLKIAYAGSKEPIRNEDEPDGGQAKKASRRKASSTSTALSRPVICICNDPYAPALRQLRKMAKVHVFVQPSVNRVVTRLKYICNMEGYKINARALTALADHTECDIRSCLNTLQFLRRKKEDLNMLDIASQVVGRKDTTRSAFDIWGEILQKRHSKRGIVSEASLASSGKCEQETREFLRLHELLANFGDFELTNDGVYDNLSHVRYHDSSLHKTVECLEVLGDSEIMNHHAVSHQRFTLTVYQPSFALAIRQLIAQPDRPLIEWPRTFQRLKVDHAAKQELMRFWMGNMQPIIYRSFSVGWDLVSPLLHILSPKKLRPVAPQLLSQSEKEELNQLVDTMIGYGINYRTPRQISSDNFVDAYGPILEPPINQLVQFKEYRSEHRPLSSTLRQVLSHEVELEKIRRESIARVARATAVAMELQGLSLLEESSRESVTNGERKLMPMLLHKRFVEEKRRDMESAVQTAAVVPQRPVIKAPKKAAVDVFARFRIASGTNGKADREPKLGDALALRDSRPLLFKFNEGFTNAIRRPVLVRDLIGMGAFNS